MTFKEGQRVFMVQANKKDGIAKLLLVRIIKFNGIIYTTQIIDKIVVLPQDYSFYKIGMKRDFASIWIDIIPVDFASKVKEIIKHYSGYLGIFDRQLFCPKEKVIFT